MPTYTDLTKVRNRLRSSRKNKIRLSSDALESFNTKKKNTNGRQPNLDLVFDYSSVVVASSFEGNIQIEFEFLNSTDYDVFLSQLPDKRRVKVGSGNVSSGFTTPDGEITFPASCFSGTIALDDVVEVTFLAHVSDDQVVEMIHEVESEIDGKLYGSYIGEEIKNSTGLIFDGVTNEVPGLVEITATYLSAYYVFTDAFADLMTEKEGSGARSFVARWKKRAEESLLLYTKACNANYRTFVTGFPMQLTTHGVSKAGKNTPEPQKIAEEFEDIYDKNDSSDLF